MNTIYSLRHYPPNERLALYGRGEAGKAVRAIIEVERPDMEVVTWIDSFDASEFMGLGTITPERIVDGLGRDFDSILITSCFTKEIVATLTSLGVTRFAVSDPQLEVIGRIEHRDALADTRCFRCVAIELTAQCNMKCAFCPSDVLERSKRPMGFDMYRAIIDNLHATGLTDTILFTGGGEPLLYKRFGEAVSYAHERGFRLELFTNGLLLTHELYRHMAERGLYNLNYSFHNFSDATFEHRRPSPMLSYAEYRERFMNLLDFHLANGFANDITIKLMVSMDRWLSAALWDLSGYSEEARDLRAHCDAFLGAIGGMLARHGGRLRIDTDQLLAEIDTLNDEEGRNSSATRVVRLADTLQVQVVKCIVSNERVMRKRRGGVGEKYRFVEADAGHCVAMQWPTVTGDGYIIPCCSTPDTHEILMDFNIGSFAAGDRFPDILESAKYRRFLDRFKDGELVEGQCRECLGRFVEIGDV